MSTASVEHIEADEYGVVRIRGKRTKVIQIVMDKMAHAWSPEEIQKQYPHLSLAEVHAAFAYYYDHQDDLDERIRQDRSTADALRSKQGESNVQACGS